MVGAFQAQKWFYSAQGAALTARALIMVLGLAKSVAMLLCSFLPHAVGLSKTNVVDEERLLLFEANKGQTNKKHTHRGSRLLRPCTCTSLPQPNALFLPVASLLLLQTGTESVVYTETIVLCETMTDGVLSLLCQKNVLINVSSSVCTYTAGF